jgi:hypothetical protein
MKKQVNSSARRKYPYARLKGMQEFMAFTQEPGWRPAQIDADLLRRLDMAKGKESEAVAALRFLGIIDEGGAPTPAFDDLKADYQPTLRRLVEQAYAELFALIPPRMANQAKLVKFFGPPVETAEYQGKLFVWLCEQAGIALPNMEKKFHRARFDKPDKPGKGPLPPTISPN